MLIDRALQLLAGLSDLPAVEPGGAVEQVGGGREEHLEEPDLPFGFEPTDLLSAEEMKTGGYRPRPVQVPQEEHARRNLQGLRAVGSSELQPSCRGGPERPFLIGIRVSGQEPGKRIGDLGPRRGPPGPLRPGREEREYPHLDAVGQVPPVLRLDAFEVAEDEIDLARKHQVFDMAAQVEGRYEEPGQGGKIERSGPRGVVKSPLSRTGPAPSGSNPSLRRAGRARNNKELPSRTEGSPAP